jgi:hypothetical protein
MKKLFLVALCAFFTSATLTAFASESDSTGQYCEAKSETCVERGATGSNELEAPAQIDWENDPAFKHGGLPPKNAK